MKKWHVLAAVVISLVLLLAPSGTAMAWGKVDVTLDVDLAIEYLEPTVLYPAPGWNVIEIYQDGELVGYRVVGRQITGTYSGTIGDQDISGDFTITYGGRLDLLQQGTIRATLVIDTGEGKILGYGKGETFLLGQGIDQNGFYVESAFNADSFYVAGRTAEYSLITGSGSFEGSIKAYLDAEGHAVGIGGNIPLEIPCKAYPSWE